MRKLASIQTINHIEPIEGYDRVEMAQVLGWTCIVKKGDFKVGDKCVYFEPDSLLYPHKIWDGFLAKRKYKIKTLKMCGVISQGLVLPISIIKEINSNSTYIEEDGFDLTDMLNVQHYQKEKDPVVTVKRKNNKFVKFMMKYSWFRFMYFLIVGKRVKLAYPTEYVSKTDEDNIQTVQHILRNNVGERFYITEKLEGQNANYMLLPKKGLFKKPKFVVCSHNLMLPENSQGSWWTIAKQFRIEEKLKNYYKKTGRCIAIQGEAIGNKIQNNIYQISGYDFYVFNVKDLTSDKFYNLEEKKVFCDEIGLKLVPVLNDNFIITEDIDAKKLLEMSNGKSVLLETQKREGFVIRKYDNDRISFKVRSPEYLLNEK